MNINLVHKTSCHCGAVQLRLKMPNSLEDSKRCLYAMSRIRRCKPL